MKTSAWDTSHALKDRLQEPTFVLGSAHFVVPSLRTDPWTGRYHFRYGHKTQADCNPSICTYVTWHHWAQFVMESMESAFVHLSPQMQIWQRSGMFLLPSGSFYPHPSRFCVVPQTRLSHALSQTCFSCFLLSSRRSEVMLPTWVNFVSSLFIAAVADRSLFFGETQLDGEYRCAREKEMSSM